MPDISDMGAVKFCNEKVRPMADLLELAYFRAKAVVAEWNARNLSAVIPNTIDKLLDGAVTDGRPVVTGAQVTNVITRCMDFIAEYEAASSAKLNTVMAVGLGVWRS